MTVDVVAFGTNWLPSRTPRAVMNERMLRGLGWGGDVYVVREDSGVVGADGANGDQRLGVHRLHPGLTRRGAGALRRLGARSLLDCPDRYNVWAAHAAFRGIQRCSRRRPDLLLTLSKFDSAHLAGLLVKQRYPELPWIASFGDPWVDFERFGYVRYNAATRRLNERLEGRVLDLADRIVVTNRHTGRLFERRRPDVADKLRVITQCYDPGSFPARTRGPARAPIVARYLGTFYNRRSPRPLLEAVRALEGASPRLAERVRFELVGGLACDDAEDCRRLLDGLASVCLVGEVSYQDSLQLMVDADALLVIDAPTDESPFLPSKLVDYLGTDRPIVALTGPGASADVVRRANGLVADVRSAEEVRDVLGRFVKLADDDALDTLQPPAEVRDGFSASRVVADFQRMTDELLATAR